MTDTTQAMPPAMADAMARLWAKFLPEIERRLGVMEEAARALREKALPDEQRAAAHADAHKLAGSLGTFGLQRGTELARQAEHLLESEAAMQKSGASLLFSESVTELRLLIDSRK